jgi:hypothetical protein
MRFNLEFMTIGALVLLPPILVSAQLTSSQIVANLESLKEMTDAIEPTANTIDITSCPEDILKTGPLNVRTPPIVSLFSKRFADNCF